jgi:hypothetical protein
LQARQYATEASEIAATAGLPELVAAAAASLWSVFNTTVAGSVGGDRWLIELCDRALEHASAISPALRARVVGMRMLLGLWLGERTDLAMGDEALRLAELAGDPVSLVVAHQARATRLQIRFESDVWDKYAAALESVIASSDDRHLVGMTAVFLSWGAMVVGDRQRLDLAQEVVESSCAVGSKRMPAWAAWLRTLVALREGRWDDAIAETTKAQELSVDRAVGDTMWAVHVGLALLNRGGASDVRAYLRGQPPLANVAGTQLAFQALTEALAGSHDDALELLARIVDGDLFANEASFLAGTGLAVWAAAVVDFAPADDAFGPRLESFRGCLAAGGLMEIGAVDRMLAMLAALRGRHDEADELFASGLALEQRYGAPAPAAHTRYWWAKSLLERDATDDRQRAEALLDECIAEAARMGMAQLESEARALR